MSTPQSVEERVVRFKTNYARLRDEIGKVIVGQDDIVEGVIIGLITGGHVTMGGAVSGWLGALTNKMRDAGAHVTASSDVYTVRAPGLLQAADVQTYPYPGFPTDLQAPYTTLMTQCEGNSSIYETMYDGRLSYVSELERMGARITVSGSGRMAMVHGPTPLQGTEVCALDIRSGAAMILAALAAEGTTTISNLVYIDRGYQDVDRKLQELGAEVSRVEESGHPCPVVDSDEPIEWGPVPPFPD